MTSLARQQQRRRLLREGATVSLVVALLLWIFASLPEAAEQRIQQARATAQPQIEALDARNTAEGPKTPEAPPTPQKTKSEAPGRTPAGTRIIRNATIYSYQAVSGQTDATPCVGAMAGVNFCKPPFLIVANNCLPLGTEVEIGFNRYTVADRMADRYGCSVFDILTNGENFKLTDIVYVL